MLTIGFDLIPNLGSLKYKKVNNSYDANWFFIKQQENHAWDACINNTKTLLFEMFLITYKY